MFIVGLTSQGTFFFHGDFLVGSSHGLVLYLGPSLAGLGCSAPPKL